MQGLRVLIADDEALVRRALQLFIDIAPDMMVVGEAQDGPSAVELCRQERPDVVLMDVRMPGGDGIPAIGQLARELPDVRAIAVTTYGSDETIASALRAGAVGFLLKDSEPDQIVAAIRAAHQGSSVLSPAVVHALMSTPEVPSRARISRGLDPAEQVSHREREVLGLLARGMSNAEMACVLCLSEATIKSHLRRIMIKWNVRDRVQVLVRAAQAGIVDFT